MIRRAGAVASCLVLAVGCVGASDDDIPEPPVSTSEPTPDAAEESEVVIETPVGETAATFVDVSAGPGPVVVLIAGSGPTDRDGNSTQLPGPIDTLRFLADGLAERGVSSIRFDKIGVGASEFPADLSAVTFGDFVVQARSVRDWVTTQSSVDPERIVLAGHSEGALIASELAAADPPAGLALITPLGERYLDLLRGQLEPALDDDGLAEFDRVVDELRSTGGLSAAPTDPTLAFLFGPITLTFLASADLSDPVELAASIDPSVRTVIVCGTVDVQVPCASLDDLRDARSDSSLTDLTLDGVNHVLRRSGEDGSVTTYTDQSLPHAVEVVDAVVRLATSS